MLDVIVCFALSRLCSIPRKWSMSEFCMVRHMSLAVPPLEDRRVPFRLMQCNRAMFASLLLLSGVPMGSWRSCCLDWFGSNRRTWLFVWHLWWCCVEVDGDFLFTVLLVDFLVCVVMNRC